MENSQESLFLRYVRHILKKWAGFQAAIDEGMAGPYAEEKEAWLAEELEHYFKRYSNIMADEVEEYLGIMLEDEFNAYFEDGSLLEVSHLLCKAYPLSINDPNASIFEELNKPSPVVCTTVPVECTTIPVESTIATVPIASLPNGHEDNSVCEQLNELQIVANAENDGWTKVERKNKKK